MTTKTNDTPTKTNTTKEERTLKNYLDQKHGIKLKQSRERLRRMEEDTDIRNMVKELLLRIDGLEIELEYLKEVKRV